MTEIYGRSILRMSTENVNLLVMRHAFDKLRAECVRSAEEVAFSIGAWMHAFETGQSKSGSIIRKRKDISGNTEQVVVDPNIVRLYLDRGVALFDICPYVFISEYRIQPVVLSKATKRRPGKKTHVHLTAAGVKALEEGAELEPRRHYEFNEGSEHQRWYKLQSESDLYYKYVIAKRDRPVIPMFTNGAPVPKSERELQARAMLMLFHPWTGNGNVATDSVPCSGDWNPRSWVHDFEQYCRSVPSERIRDLIINFQAVYATRQQDDDNADDPYTEYNSFGVAYEPEQCRASTR